MNPMLQRHCAKFIYIVPDGLRELMSDISREVIRTQPQQIYTYIADYLDALMITRENARIAARLVESITEIAQTTVEILLNIGLSRPEADTIVAIIQTAFREHLEQKKKYEHALEVPGEIEEEEEFTQKIMNQLDVTHGKLEEMACIIQNAYRRFKERQEREKQLLFGMVDWRVAARSAIALYRKTGVTKYEANRAATLIKAAYKGYYTRRIMRRLLKKGLDDEITVSEETLEESEEEEGEAKSESELDQIPAYLQGIKTYHGEHDDIIADYVGLTADQVTQPTGDAERAEPHESWSPYTEGQVTDEGQTLPMDGEMAPEEEGTRLDLHRSQIGEDHDDAGAGDITEESEGKMPPPNTEDVVSSVVDPMSAPAEAEEMPQIDGDNARDDTIVPTTPDGPTSDTEASSPAPTTDYTTDESGEEQ